MMNHPPPPEPVQPQQPRGLAPLAPRGVWLVVRPEISELIRLYEERITFLRRFEWRMKYEFTIGACCICFEDNAGLLRLSCGHQGTCPPCLLNHLLQKNPTVRPMSLFVGNEPRHRNPFAALDFRCAVCRNKPEFISPVTRLGNLVTICIHCHTEEAKYAFRRCGHLACCRVCAEWCNETIRLTKKQPFSCKEAGCAANDNFGLFRVYGTDAEFAPAVDAASEQE